MGFCGASLDLRGYKDSGAEQAALELNLGDPVVRSADGNLVGFSLKAAHDRLLRQSGGVALDAARTYLRRPVALSPGDGLIGSTSAAPSVAMLVAAPQGIVHVDNLSSEARRVTLTANPDDGVTLSTSSTPTSAAPATQLTVGVAAGGRTDVTLAAQHPGAVYTLAVHTEGAWVVDADGSLRELSAG